MPQPTRLPLVVYPENRDSTTNKDARLVNGFVEKTGENTLHIFKRPALLDGGLVSAAVGRGIFYWNSNIYTIFGGTFYEAGVSKGSVQNAGIYTFSSCLGATPTLFFHNGSKGYTYNSGAGLVAVTDGDYPNALVPGSAYLDGTTYVMIPTTAALQGSDFNNPASWDPLNSLIAQIEPDQGVAIAKQLVYVVALKQWSTEFFYDAGNAAGSPLGAVQGAKINIGCRSAASVRDVGGALAWIGTTREGSICVVLVDNVKAQIISTPQVERLLQAVDYSEVYSWTAKVSGHRFYGVTSVISNLTLVYDLSTGLWAQWTDPSGNYFPIVDSTMNTTAQAVLQHASNGHLYTLDLATYQDAGTTFPVDIYTPNFDGGTRVRKYLQRIDVVADQQANSTLQLQFSEDDYQTWSTARDVDLSVARPYITDCGTFKRRAYHIHHSANTPLRLESLELFLDLGTL